MEWNRLIGDIWHYHRGKAAGVILGLGFGLFVVIIGFWLTLFIAVCLGLGFLVGKKVDETGSFQGFLNHLLAKINNLFRNR